MMMVRVREKGEEEESGPHGRSLEGMVFTIFTLDGEGRQLKTSGGRG